MKPKHRHFVCENKYTYPRSYNLILIIGRGEKRDIATPPYYCTTNWSYYNIRLGWDRHNAGEAITYS